MYIVTNVSLKIIRNTLEFYAENMVFSNYFTWWQSQNVTAIFIIFGCILHYIVKIYHKKYYLLIYT